MKALILSAGYGTRLRPYSDLTPKPMFTLAGQPLLDLHIRMLENTNCRAVAVNTHHLNESIEDFIGRQRYAIPVHLYHEPELLGTGGAIKNLADFWEDEPFMVINSDIFHEFDLDAIFAFHCSHSHPATVVLWNDANFNSVLVDKHDCVKSFRRRHLGRISSGDRYLTFTGIQVLDSEFLGYIPADRPFDSIDAYSEMMAAGHTVKSYRPRQGSWADLGTPGRYRLMARKMTAAAGFSTAYDDTEAAGIKFERLAGDGSQRHWYRLRSGHRTLIMCDHGLKEHPGVGEVDAFVAIGSHLKQLDLPVPQIHFHDRFAGLVVLDDLGDINLQTAVLQSDSNTEIQGWYRQIIADLIEMSAKAIEGFNFDWAYQGGAYDRDLILEKECRYFVDAFLNGYLDLTLEFEALRSEFEHLASETLQRALVGLMHRDLQSRNIMVADNRFYLIDFQAARAGPLQYDLASLLLDPYVELPESLQAELLDYALDLAVNRCDADPDDFRIGYRYCALSRNLQVLGAFGFLSRVRSKTFFEPYIAPAVRSLARRLARFGGDEFKELRQLVTGQVLPRFGS
jgi:aminoglycoside/choline kinase family phosphotransferase/GTP:adenosylcobinamide-phosphate guanylyltransferase